MQQYQLDEQITSGIEYLETKERPFENVEVPTYHESRKDIEKPIRINSLIAPEIGSHFANFTLFNR
ncbi:hypothetical protein CHS0354_009827, partial [Potamilus streckersoni]